MDIGFIAVMNEAAANPILALILILSVGTIIVNGATDAPNAIATCVGTRSMSPGKAIAMAALMNFLGCSILTLFSTAVANTVFNMFDFGGDSTASLIALASAMVAVIVWGVAAWFFGIPTSQSHSLIAGLTGASIALSAGFSGVHWGEWMKVIYGLFFSAGLGFGLGWGLTRFLGWACRDLDHRKSDKPFGRLQDAAAALLAFMHGAQDGQKFMSVCMLGVLLAMGQGQQETLVFPLWVEILCAGSMGIGTAIGGKRIIKSVGMEMVKLEKWQGFSATLSAAIGIFFSTILGLPISTTHTKTTAIMGVGSARRLRAVNWGEAKNMALTWVFTFPGCGLIAYAICEIALLVM